MSEVLTVSTAAQSSKAMAYLELTKPRIAALVLVTTSVGFYLASEGAVNVEFAVRLLAALIGTALVAGGSSAFNQLIEQSRDARMHRTEFRPLPSGRLTRAEVAVFGAITSLGGLGLLAWQVNGLTAMLAALTWLIYVVMYTPLKRAGSAGVLVGAVSGALPPVIGWAAAMGQVTTGGWLLFLILYFWQLPHFAAIAWLYREDYARAGYPFLPVVDVEGHRTNLHIVTHTVGLIVATLLPAVLGMVGPVYVVGAMILGAAFLGCGLLFIGRKQPKFARVVIFASVTYLPALLALMMLDKA